MWGICVCGRKGITLWHYFPPSISMWSPGMEIRLPGLLVQQMPSPVEPLTDLWTPSIPKDKLESSDVLKTRKTITWLENATVSSGSNLWKGKCCLEQSLIIFHLSVRQAMLSPPQQPLHRDCRKALVLKKSTLTNQCQGLPSPEYLPPKLSVLGCCVRLPWSCLSPFYWCNLRCKPELKPPQS